jgi:hypothetical protein
VTPEYEALATQLTRFDEHITEILRRRNMAFELTGTCYQQDETVTQASGVFKKKRRAR